MSNIEHGNTRDTVVIFGPFVLPDKNAAAQQAIGRAMLFQQCGYQVVLVGKDPQVGALDLSEGLKVNGFVSYRLNYPNSTRQWMRELYQIKDYCSILEKVGMESVFAIVDMDIAFLAKSRLRKLAGKNGIRYIVDTMDWIPKSERSFPSNLVKDLDTWVRMKRQNVKAGNVICVSRFLDDYYRQRGCNCIQLGVLIDKRGEKWKSSFTYQPNKPLRLVYAGSPGSIGYKERIDWVVKAVCELGEEGIGLAFQILGITREQFLKHCPEFQDREFFMNHIVFEGRVPHEDCLQAVRAADFSVLIRENKFEMNAGFPTKLAESLACGTPVMATDTSNILDFIGQGEEIGVVPSRISYDCTKETLRRICGFSQERLREMHQNCLNFSKLDCNQYVAQFEAFLDKVGR